MLAALTEFSILESLSSFPSNFDNSLRLLISTIQIIGGILGIYALLLLFNIILSIKREKKINRILSILEEINNKLSKLGKI
ncbi:MAG: hypothetical protein QXJ28_00990 [Candidatus Pacearchaeota archaeon]